MILDVLENAQSYVGLSAGFAEAFAFLQRPDVKELTNGRHDVDGERIFVLAQNGPGRKREGAQLEAHKRYADIQLVLAGVDEMGWKATSNCEQPAGGFDEENDVQFFDDEPDAWITTRAGHFVIYMPGDAHLPTISTGNIHKIVAKIRLD